MSETPKKNGHSLWNKKDNVIRMPTPEERDKEKKRREKEWQKQYKKQNHEPLINLPPFTKYSILILVVIHLILFICPSSVQYSVMAMLGFTPGVYTGTIEFGWNAFLMPVSYMFLHGSWMHLTMNSVMLAAFGSGIEKWLGAKRMMILMFGSGLIAVLAHFALYSMSTYPVVGASGAISGLFAAVIIMLGRGGALPIGKYGIWPIILLWIGITITFGMIGGPEGESIAWAAHLGGFAGGFMIMKMMKLI